MFYLRSSYIYFLRNEHNSAYNPLTGEGLRDIEIERETVRSVQVLREPIDRRVVNPQRKEATRLLAVCREVRIFPPQHASILLEGRNSHRGLFPSSEDTISRLEILFQVFRVRKRVFAVRVLRGRTLAKGEKGNKG